MSCRFISPEGKATVALRDFSMSVARGEFIAIVGPTGCGKSTTLNLITGLLKPATGEVRVMGRPVDGIDPRIGFVFHRRGVPVAQRDRQRRGGPVFRGRSKDVAYTQAEEWIRKVGLDKFTKHYPHQLSGGMRKRVALAQTFINQPEILLMDEPFSALDMQTRTLMQDELLQLWSANKAGGVRHARSRGGDRAGRPRVRADRAARHAQARTRSTCRARASRRRSATTRASSKFRHLARPARRSADRLTHTLKARTARTGA